jgi:hypothetical protein
MDDGTWDPDLREEISSADKCEEKQWKEES